MLTIVIVAEVTQPSLGVGYELGRAIENNIPTCCLFRPNNDHGRSKFYFQSVTFLLKTF